MALFNKSVYVSITSVSVWSTYSNLCKVPYFAGELASLSSMSENPWSKLGILDALGEEM